MIKSDIALKQDIEEELRWDPRVNASQIAVTVNEGAVSLLGVVDTYPERWAAEDAVKRVSGVRTVAQDLEVKVLGEHARSDSEIAQAVQSALKWDVLVPAAVTAKVQDGIITLEGEVAWDFERRAAERAVRHLAGVVATYNAVTLEGKASASQVKEKIESALHRQAWSDASSIEVATTGSKVTLSGHASSFQMIKDARNAAWSVPGVNAVEEHVRIAATS